MKPTPAQAVRQSLKNSWDSVKSEPLNAGNLKRNSLPLAHDVAACFKEKAHSTIAEASTSLQNSSLFAKCRSALGGDETHKTPGGQQGSEMGGPLWFHDDFHNTYDPMGYSNAFQPYAKNQAQTDRREEMKEYWQAKSNRSGIGSIPRATGSDTRHGAEKQSSESVDRQLEDSKSSVNAVDKASR